jgi:hypothetical protein
MKRRDLIARYVVLAMEERGVMSMQEIYDAVMAQYVRLNRGFVRNWKDQIRNTLQGYCRGCPEHARRSGDDYFVHHGRGAWSCKITAAAHFPVLRAAAKV